MAYSIDRSRGKVSDIKQDIERKRGELAQFEEQKSSLLDAGREVLDSDLDERTQRVLMNEVNQALEANSEKAEEVGREMEGDIAEIEDEKQEAQASLDSNAVQRSRMEQRKALLDRFGIGSSMDGALSELDDNRADLEDLQSSLIETGRELDELGRRFSTL